MNYAEIFVLKNSVRLLSPEQLKAAARDCRDNAAYNSANGFEASSIQNRAEAEFFESLVK